jgi:hypothetical protein
LTPLNPGLLSGCFALKQVGGMLIVETIDRIRRGHLVKGKSIKEIAGDLRISRNTVLRSGESRHAPG